MPLISITIKDPKALEHIKALADSGAKLVLPGLMDDIGQYMTKYAANEGMASQGGVFDANWPRLSQKYAVYKAKKFPGRSIMERSGKLKDSWGYNASETGVDLGNNTKYWVYHQGGGKHLPKRVLISINETNKKKIGEFIGHALERKFNAA
jgi:phage gpG-like protein